MPAGQVNMTLEYIQQKFDHYNRLIFCGRLPRIPIRLSNAKTYLGQCVSRVITLPDGRKEHTDFELRISTRLDLAPDTIDDTIIHEMIHYFIHYNGLHDTSAHGPLFRSLMHSINIAHGRKLTISHRSTPDERASADSAPRWHVIAILRLNDPDPDKIGVKVLPRTTDKIIQYYHRVLAAPQVASIDLYLHSAPFFNRYPVSAAMRYHPASLSEVTPHLADARRLTVEGSTITYVKH